MLFYVTTAIMKNQGIYSSSRDEIASFLSSVSKKDMSLVLDDLCTPQEIVELAERIHILRQLKAGKTQRVIADDLWLSVTTVTRGSRVLQYGAGVIQKYI